MRHKLAAARQLGLSGLSRRFLWRFLLACRVLRFRAYRRARAGAFVKQGIPVLRAAPVRSYLPDFGPVAEQLARSPDLDRRSRERVAAACQRLVNDEVLLRGVGLTRLNFTPGNWYDYDRDAAIMVNRHDFLLPLVQSAVLSQDPEARSTVNRLFGYWVSSFRFEQLLRRDTPIDAAIRMLNWAWVFNTRLLELPVDTSRKLCEIIYIQLEYIAAWQSAGGNHLVLEALSNYVYGLMFRSTTAGARWSGWSRPCLLRQLLRQSTADGVHTEQSMFYHQAVSTHFLKFILASIRADDPIPQAHTERFGKMLDYVHQTMKPNLTHPVLGDGEAMLTDDREHWEAKALLAARSHLFQKSIAEDFLPQVNDAAVWLLGCPVPGIRTRREPPGSKVLESSGLAVLRDENDYVFFDAAPFADPEFPHHGHADALQIELCVESHDLFIDPGGYGYYDDPFRRFFRSTAAHNTITLDGRDQSGLFGVLGYGRLARATIETFSLSADMDYIAGSHDGFHPSRHVREVVLYKRDDRFLVIVDRLDADGQHTAVSRLHMPPGVTMDVEQRRIEVRSASRVFHFDVVSDAAREEQVVRGVRNGTVQGWISPETKMVVESETWEATTQFAGRALIVTAVALEDRTPLRLWLDSAAQVRLQAGSGMYLLSVRADGRQTGIVVSKER